MRPQGTVFYQFYRGISALAAPLIWRRVSAKLAREGVPENRRRERLGHATEDRPDGRLIWFHAASVGESLSILTLADRLMTRMPGAQALITSGTASSAEILSKRMPEGCRHQFAPLDNRAALRRFLDHWRPDAGIFVESEIWPQMLVEAQSRGLKLALVNARMSRTSLKNWARFDHTARYLLSLFSLIRTQDQATCDGLLALGADPATTALGPNLKSTAAPLPVDPDALVALADALDGPLWLAASTHEGEEKQVLKAHLEARKTHPDLRLILAPRHVERAEAIAEEIRAQGLTLARRGAGEAPGDADVYLADTLGEMGLWFSLAPVVFIGGTFGPAGGHNPYEPAQFGVPMIAGPRYANFTDVYAEFEAAAALDIVKKPKELGRQVAALLSNPLEAAEKGSAARAIVSRQSSALDDLTELLQAKLFG